MVCVLALLLISLNLYNYCFAKNTKLLYKVKHFYKNIKTISGEFIQKNYLPSGKVKIYYGKFWIKKPDKIKWKYLSPDHFTILYISKKLYIYYPEEGEVFVYSAEKNYSSKLILNLLSGDPDFKSLNIKKIKVISPDMCDVILNPPEDSYLKNIEVFIDCKKGEIKGFSYESNIGEKIKVFLTKVLYNSHFSKKILELKK